MHVFSADWGGAISAGLLVVSRYKSRNSQIPLQRLVANLLRLSHILLNTVTVTVTC